MAMVRERLITARAVIVHRRSSPAAPRFDVEVKVAGDEPLTTPQMPGLELRLDDILRE
jgi:hypothetical protein